MRQRRKLDNRLKLAARAGWLYYIADLSQTEIARRLGVTRSMAQRLVALSVSSGMLKVRLRYTITRCAELAISLKKRWSLDLVEVVPTDPAAPDGTLGVATALAAEIERWLAKTEPSTIAVGPGHLVLGALAQVASVAPRRHRVVSLWDTSPAGSHDTCYGIVDRFGHLMGASYFPMPISVRGTSAEQRELLLRLPVFRHAYAAASEADVTFVSIEDLGPDAALLRDGDVSADQLQQLRDAQGVCEIAGWVFNTHGEPIKSRLSELVAGPPLPAHNSSLVIGVAVGASRLGAIKAAVTGGIIGGLITDERTAEALLHETG